MRTGEQLFPGRERWADASALGQERRTGGPGQQVPGKNYQLIQTHHSSRQGQGKYNDENKLSKLYFFRRIKLKDCLQQCWTSAGNFNFSLSHFFAVSGPLVKVLLVLTLSFVQESLWMHRGGQADRGSRSPARTISWFKHITVYAKGKEVYGTNRRKFTEQSKFFCSRIRVKESLPMWFKE